MIFGLVNQMLAWGLYYIYRENWFLTSSSWVAFTSSTIISSTIISSTPISSTVHFVESSFHRQSLHLCIILMINEVMIVMATILSLTILVFITIDNNNFFNRVCGSDKLVIFLSWYINLSHSYTCKLISTLILSEFSEFHQGCIISNFFLKYNHTNANYTNNK